MKIEIDAEQIKQIVEDYVAGCRLDVYVSRESDYYNRYLQVEVTLFDPEGNRISTAASSVSVE